MSPRRAPDVWPALFIWARSTGVTSQTSTALCCIWQIWGCALKAATLYLWSEDPIGACIRLATVKNVYKQHFVLGGRAMKVDMKAPTERRWMFEWERVQLGGSSKTPKFSKQLAKWIVLPLNLFSNRQIICSMESHLVSSFLLCETWSQKVATLAQL